MRWKAGTTDVPTAGTRVQISNTPDKVLSIFVRARLGNTGNVYFGISDVASTLGLELEPGASHTTTFGEGSILFSSLYADAATSGDDLDWAAVLK